MARAVGATAVEADARATAAFLDAVFGDKAALADMRSWRDVAASLDDGPITTKISVNLTHCLGLLESYDVAVREHRDGIEVAQRHGLMGTLGMLLGGNVWRRSRRWVGGTKPSNCTLAWSGAMTRPRCNAGQPQSADGA